jgi:hypothetical protein
MEQTQTVKTIPEDENVTVSVNFCVNTNRTYIYELKNGDIISEKTIHGV